MNYGCYDPEVWPSVTIGFKICKEMQTILKFPSTYVLWYLVHIFPGTCVPHNYVPWYLIFICTHMIFCDYVSQYLCFIILIFPLTYWYVSYIYVCHYLCYLVLFAWTYVLWQIHFTILMFTSTYSLFPSTKVTQYLCIVTYLCLPIVMFPNLISLIPMFIVPDTIPAL